MNQTVDLLKRLIEIPSYVGEDCNEEKLADFIVGLISDKTDLKITEQVVSEGRRNLIITDGETPKVVLFGHMDTVLPKKQEKDPLSPYEEDEKIYGLGSVDMKAGLAVMLDIALNHHRKGVGYVFSVDEEFNFEGSKKLMEINDLKPDYIINLEPTSLEIINGCRGITEFSFEVFGKSAHAGRKMVGINAIEKAVELIQLFEKECQNDDPEGMTTSVNLAYLNGGLKVDEKSEIKAMGNVVPNYAKLIAEIRIANKKITEQYIKEKFEELSKMIGVELGEISFKFFLGSMLTPKEELRDFEEAIRKVGMEVKYADINLAGYYELQILLSKWGGKGVAFGPGPIELSHAENEYVEIESVMKTKQIMLQFIGDALGQ